MANLALKQPTNPETVVQGGMLIVIGPSGQAFPDTAKPDTSALPAGWYPIIVLREAPSIEGGAETEQIPVGPLALSAGSVFKSMKGSIKGKGLGLDLNLLAAAAGVLPVITSASPTATSSAFTVDVATGNSKVTLTSAAGLVVGDAVCFNPASGILIKGNVASIATNDIVLDRRIYNPPASGAVAAKFVKLTMPVGSANRRTFAVAGILEFVKPAGALTSPVSVFSLPIAESTESLTLEVGAGTEPMEVPFAFNGIANPASEDATLMTITHWN